jgi:hypothetical protein
MATVSRSRSPQRARVPLAAVAAVETLRTWALPAAAAVAIAVSIGLASAGVVEPLHGLAATILATLVLLLWIGERPLFGPGRTAQDRALGGALAAVWLVACYAPFHTRLFPGTPLVAPTEISAAGKGLPLRVPSSGRGALDLVLEGHLTPNPAGGAAPPLHYRLTIEGGAGPTVLDGVFEDRLSTRRLGRRGTAVVHQAHTADVRMLANPGGGDLTVTHLALEPESAQPITLSAFPHPLPGPIVLALLATALVAAVVAFDRLGPAPETDGALTLSTAAVIGTAIIFWTSNAVHPDISALIGSVIFGGPLGFMAGATLWWMVKRLIVRPTR